MSWFQGFTDTAVKVGTDAAKGYLEKEGLINTGVVGPTATPPATVTTSSKPAWLIPAIIGGVVLLVIGYFATRAGK